MPETVSVTQSASFPVIQGAYEWFFATDSYAAGAGQEMECSAVATYRTYFPEVPYIALATEPPMREWLKFQRLARQWVRERGAMSSITEAATCPAYQSIIGMGETVIPFIFYQLQSEGSEPDQWFWALKVLNGVDPVGEEDRGNYLRMAEAWLRWGKLNGYAG